MEILDINSALLSNYEIYSHLQQQKVNRSIQDKRLISSYNKSSTKVYENLRTIEFEVIQYLSEMNVVMMQNDRMIKSFLSNFKTISLTKAEKLQILNLRPKTILELHLIIEECEERFSEEQIEEILSAIGVLLPISVSEETTDSLTPMNSHEANNVNEKALSIDLENDMTGFSDILPSFEEYL